MVKEFFSLFVLHAGEDVFSARWKQRELSNSRWSGSFKIDWAYLKVPWRGEKYMFFYNWTVLISFVLWPLKVSAWLSVCTCEEQTKQRVFSLIECRFYRFIEKKQASCMALKKKKKKNWLLVSGHITKSKTQTAEIQERGSCCYNKNRQTLELFLLSRLFSFIYLTFWGWKELQKFWTKQRICQYLKGILSTALPLRKSSLVNNWIVITEKYNN